MKTTLQGTMRTTATADQLRRTAACYTGTPDGARTMCKIARGWALLDAVTVTTDGRGNAAWTAELRTGVQRSRRWEPSDAVSATADDVSRALLATLRLVRLGDREAEMKGRAA